MRIIWSGITGFLLLFSAASFEAGYAIMGVFFLCSGLLSGIKAYKSGKPHLPQLQASALAALPKAQAEEAEACWQKAIVDAQRIDKARRQLRDPEIRRQLALLQQDAGRMFAYLESHPDRILIARRFIDSYQDRTASLVEEYQELESTGLSTDKVQELRGRLVETLYGFQSAYEAEFQKVVDHQLMDMDAELTVMKQSMAADGIKPKPQVREPYHPRLPEPRIKALKRRVTSFVDRRRPTGPYELLPENVQGDVLKEKLIMSALAIFLGAIGAHKFYQGKAKWGILYLLLCWTGIPGLLGILEGIRYLFMRTDSFYEQYYHKNNEVE